MNFSCSKVGSFCFLESKYQMFQFLKWPQEAGSKKEKFAIDSNIKSSDFTPEIDPDSFYCHMHSSHCHRDLVSVQPEQDQTVNRNCGLWSWWQKEKLHLHTPYNTNIDIRNKYTVLAQKHNTHENTVHTQTQFTVDCRAATKCAYWKKARGGEGALACVYLAQISNLLARRLGRTILTLCWVYS